MWIAENLSTESHNFPFKSSKNRDKLENQFKWNNSAGCPSHYAAVPEWAIKLYIREFLLFEESPDLPFNICKNACMEKLQTHTTLAYIFKYTQ